MSGALIGKVLGKYRIVEKLGSGGMADVFRGIQIGLDREVAIKVLPHALAADREMVKRFRRESQATAKLSHPNIITIYDSGEQDGSYFYVMEFLKTDSLADVLEREKPLAPGRALKIGQDLLKALVYCHEKEVVHRDLKPANVKFDMRENAILTDFGLSELDAAPPDARSDLYQTGAILYEMLTGRKPGKAVQPPSELNGDVPPDLSQLVVRALQEDPGARFQTAKDMLAELKKVELKQKAKKLTRATMQVSRQSAVPPHQTGSFASGEMSQGEGSGYGSSLSALLASPKDRESLAKLLAVTVPVFLLGLVGVLWAFGILPARQDVKLVEQTRDVEATRATLSWKCTPACYAQVEYWPAAASQSKLRTRRLPARTTEHRHAVPDLRPDTTYNFRFLFSRSPDEDGETCASEVFDFTTRPEIQIFNIHVDEYATKAVVTWETNLRTDTTVKYGKTDQYEDLRTNPEQKAETIHSMNLEGLSAETTYHYQIVAADPQGRGQPRLSEDLQFRSAKDGAVESPGGNQGLVNLTRSYVDKLSRMTPDEREKLKASLSKFMDPKMELSPADKKTLLDAKTSPNRDDDFNNRLQLARAWFLRLKERKKDVVRWDRRPSLISTQYYSNHLAGAIKLDRFLKELSELDS